MKTGIFYGSSLGTTEEIAGLIAGKLGVAANDIHNVDRADVSLTASYDCLLLGSSTWGDGELQDDWYDFLKKLKTADLSGKYIGLFGCGDAEGYPDTFCDALGILHESLSDRGATMIGSYVPEDYPETDSKVNVNGRFVGLALDESNQIGLTGKRIDCWVALIRQELS